MAFPTPSVTSVNLTVSTTETRKVFSLYTRCAFSDWTEMPSIARRRVPPLSTIFSAMASATLEGMAYPMFSIELDTILALTMPMSSPFSLYSPPPEFPELTAASTRMTRNSWLFCLLSTAVI